MLQLIYGCPGSGKSRYLSDLIAGRLEKGKKVILIVPERFSVTAEQRVIDRCAGKNTMDLDVLSFKRLCNRVFREYGGLCYNYAGKGGRILMMYRALCGVRGDLEVYGGLNLRDGKTVETMLEGVVSFKRAALTPEIFEDIGQSLDEDPQLGGKVRDLAKIWREYDRLLTEKYDDPEEDLTRLAGLLATHPFFEDKEVFIDSTVAFTGQEMRVVKAAIEQSPFVTAALCFLPEDERPMMAQMRLTEKQLTDAAKDAGVAYKCIKILDKPCKKSEDLTAFERFLFSDGKAREIPVEHIRTDVFQTVYEECKTIAARILADVQAGGRFMDHAVAVRDLDGYKGVIDEVFTANGVPFTMTDKVCLSDRSAGRFLLSALRLAAGDFRLDDLVEYMKTGYSGLSDTECFELEDYANLWQIEGAARWLSGDPFMMNPDGHAAVTEERQLEKLESINAARKTLTMPLEAFCQDFSACKNTEEYAEALFGFMDETHLENLLADRAKESFEAHDGREEQLHAQTFAALCRTLDDAVSAMGDVPCTGDEFLMMMEILLQKKELASIPAGKDRVLVSDAFNLSPSGVRTLHAAGVNDGVFPSVAKENSMFTPVEATALRGKRIELPGSGERRALDEQYLCYTVLTLPRERLYVSSYLRDLRGASAKGSDLFEEIAEFCKNGKREEEDLLYGRANCLEAALQNRGDAVSAALRAYFEKMSGEAFENLSRAPLVETSDRLSKEITRELYGEGPLRLSQSRLESFVNCPFSYTCQHILRLQDKPSPDLEANEVGTIVHEVIEKLIGGCLEGGEEFGALTDAQIDRRITDIVDGIKERTFGDRCDLIYEKFYERLKTYVKVLGLNLRDEFEQSEFKPVFCELPFGRSVGEGAFSLPEVVTRGKEKVSLRGVADRVDVLKKDGKIYLRIIDYKTGSKEFDPDAVKKGLNTQMLLYLKALRESDNATLREKLGMKEGQELRPAGVLYYIAKPEPVAADVSLSAEQIREKIEKSIKRSGLLIDDKEILEAMDKGLRGRFVPLKTLERKKALIPEEELDKELEGLDGMLSDIAGDMRSGRADATPDEKKGAKSGCEYCPMGPVCRAKNAINAEEGGDGPCR